MRSLSAIALVLLLSLSLFAQSPSAASKPAPEVFLVGSVHQFHFDPQNNYSLPDLQNELEALHPDLICGEITPEAYQSPMEGYFPAEAAFLAEIAPSLHARFAPTDWRIAFAWQSRANSMVPKQVMDQVEAVAGQMLKDMQTRTRPSLFDYVHTDLIPLNDRQFEEIIGENTVADIGFGGWHERNRRIVENCLDAGERARRIVLVYGAQHLPELRRQFAARGIQAQIASRHFTPSGLGTVPPSVVARWQRNSENLKGILEGRIAVSHDSLDKVKYSSGKSLDTALKTYAPNQQRITP